MSELHLLVVCAEPGAFHDRHGRTVIRSFVRHARAGGAFAWAEEVAERAAVRKRRTEAGLPTQVDAPLTKRRVTTQMRGSGGTPKRTVGLPHVDLRCRGCGLSRREPGAKLWPIFDAYASMERSEVSLREIIDALSGAP